jgi:uncharacterized protein (DUF488 family)
MSRSPAFTSTPATTSEPERPGGQELLLYTVGHGTMAGEAFAAMVVTAGIGSLVDVRSVPASRRNPQFGREALSDRLHAVGVTYRWEPRLGGFRRPVPGSPNDALRHASFRAYADYMATAEFRAALDELLDGAARSPTAVLCAETLWWRCHRRLLADAAVILGGAQVRHLGHDGRLTDHRLTPGVRPDASSGLVYALGSGEAAGIEGDPPG